MTVTQEQLDSFHRFASEKLGNGGGELTWQELLALWRLENPSEQERSQTNAAIRNALEEIEAGLVQPADEAMEEIRKDFGFSK